MKMHSGNDAEGHRITSYGDGFVAVDNEVIRQPFVVTPERVLRDWQPDSVESIGESAMRELTELGAEVVLLGTGERQRFPQAELFGIVTGAGIGLEVMDTPAACRTFNILVAEGRRVAAALIVGAG